MTEADFQAVAYASLFLVLGSLIASFIFQGVLVGSERHGYTQRNSRRDAAIMRARIENMIHRNQER